MSGLLAWIEEALAPLGVVTSRAMMGGRVLYCDGTIFAILADDDLWFKADADSNALWDEAGCARFTYQMRDRIETMNYRRAPGDVHDDPDEMQRWAEIAIAAGARGQSRKARRR